MLLIMRRNQTLEMYYVEPHKDLTLDHYNLKFILTMSQANCIIFPLQTTLMFSFREIL